jgi:hypothetical protein
LGIDNSVVPARALGGWQEALNMFQLILSQQSSVISRQSIDNYPSKTDDRRQTTDDLSNPGRMIRALSSSDMYRRYLEAEYPDWKERVEDLEQLASFADVYPDVSSFLADSVLEGAGFVAPAGQIQNSKFKIQDNERMVLSTIHQAKGLEWDTVFVIHLTNLGFPNPRALEEGDAIEEERRLFYVAVTRARNRLFLSYPQTAGYDAMTFCRPSMFVEELPPRLFEKQNISNIEYGISNVAKNSAGRSGRFRTSEDDGGGYDEPSIDISDGNYRPSKGPTSFQSKPMTVSVWKSSTPTPRVSSPHLPASGGELSADGGDPSGDMPKISYLRDVDEM